MATPPLRVRVDRHLRRLFFFFALTVFCFIIGGALKSDGGSVSEPVGFPLLVGIFIACFIPLATGFVIFHRRRWSLESDAVTIVGLFRHHEIPWSEISAVRIESFNDETTHKLTLRKLDGKKMTINVAEFVLEGEGRVAPSEWRLPDRARDKTELVKSLAPNWGLLATISVFGVVVMVWTSCLILLMSPRY